VSVARGAGDTWRAHASRSVAPGLDRPRVGLVIGTRPEAVKLAPVVAEMRRTGRLEPIVISTRQQRDLLPSTLADLELTVDYELPAPLDHGLADRLAQTIAGTAALLGAVPLAAIVVQGDTISSLGAAQAAFFSGVAVVHVEAGLRSGNRLSPFPEEVNRKSISVLAALHLAPTQDAADHLRAEGIPPETVLVTGNTGVDALHAYAAEDGVADEWLGGLVASGRRIVVLTMHRRESWGEPMRGVSEAVADVLAHRDDTVVVVPAHPNPVVREALTALVAAPDAIVIEPLPYRRFLRLLSVADLVLTDSGGIQEEAPSFGVPVLVLREVTERSEGVRAGVAVMVGLDPEAVSRHLRETLDRPRRPGAMHPGGTNPYGDGRASQRCVAAIVDLLGPTHTEPSHPQPSQARPSHPQPSQAQPSQARPSHAQSTSAISLS
jgi:UDP-N-acetylglucosamine 2-epimerase (non-hydrolysing)